jgi:hypothetical protein
MSGSGLGEHVPEFSMMIRCGYCCSGSVVMLDAVPFDCIMVIIAVAVVVVLEVDAPNDNADADADMLC